MPRVAKIWQRGQDGWWYCKHKGKQVKLSRDKKEAQTAFHELKSNKDDDQPKEYRPSFRKLADEYLDFTKQTKDARTYKLQLYFLQSFCDHVKARKASELRPKDVTDWLLKNPSWQHNSQVTAKGILRACLNWAIDQELLPHNPLQRVKTGTAHRRERILTAEERKKIREAVRDREFSNYLFFMEKSGARPFSEAGLLTGEMIDFQEGTITFIKHKNARKGKKRVIYMAPALAEFLKPLCAERPEGFLFRTIHDRPFNNQNTNGRVRRLEMKLKLKRFSLNAYRKSYITDSLEKGLSSDIVAELCGNTSKTIGKYYNLLSEKTDALKEAARKAAGD